MKKTAIIVLGAPGIHEEMICMSKSTWDSVHHPDINTYYLYGQRADLECQGAPISKYHNILVSDTPENRENILAKTLNAFGWFLMQPYTYLFRTCSCSYIYKARMSEWLKDKPTTNFYAGCDGPWKGKDKAYVSGAGMFLSRDLVKLLYDNKEEVQRMYECIDDVTIGKFLLSKGIQIYPEIMERCQMHTYADKVPGFAHYHITTNFSDAEKPKIMWHIHQEEKDLCL
jgi:hypothetical protein